MYDIEMRDDTNENQQIQSKKSSLPFVEKYRPSSVTEIISHEEILSTISRFISQKSIPHFLFYGPPGTGKTTCALALARQLYGDIYKNMILELNASDDRGIQVVRNKIKDFCGALGSFNNLNINNGNNFNMFKLVILDEADMMTSDAQNALRRIMEKYTKNSRFCLICNQVNKINMAIQSRCMRFRFSPLKKEQCIMRLKDICTKENINYNSDETLYKIVEIAKGDMRKILNLLEATFMASSNSTIDENAVYACAGLPTPSQFRMFIQVCNRKGNFGKIFQELNDMRIQNGFAMVDLIDQLTIFVRENKEISENNKVEIFLLLGKMDYLCNIGGDEKIILSNFVSIIRKYNLI